MVFNFMILFNLISLMVVRKHYLMTLIVIEIIFITLMNLFYYYLNFYYFENSLGLVYLIMGVVDSSLGLSLLVYLVRSVNLPYISSFSLC
ncbi:NADH dehydrogenase subunit 4L (mitochondrion) [Nilaparvata lugens]|uniref:NADH dehydrogenase subunit 4L n=1 Tax=Nilaparvata lugens TaxID=108931 RepID=S4TK01_NILLU|nr:NADH dehydrogenase subunit 4L [Nilaparvata lugens]UVW80478.1 NADH dehydrogenase subunit 4L [Leptocorisa oratoria]AEP27259.1 NADH dehydrogenase subunit 4L [Nilaparvata lugens]AEP27274.1 NADH dehydrogenase subunit 4L [Nilaparvata lugens]AEP27287.1 NADH dehydrogenase subunit 4L [Nilaparvata lugens]AGC22533.1 NADH dehydrogenase subunit 4L [Nilaparvata lugens]